MSIWHGLALFFISDAAPDVHRAHKNISYRLLVESSPDD